MSDKKDDSNDEHKLSQHIEVADDDLKSDKTPEAASEDVISQDESVDESKADGSKKQKRKFKKEYVLVGVVIASFSTLGFVGGIAYNANQQAREHEAKLRTALDEKTSLEKKLKEISLKSSDASEDSALDPEPAKTEESLSPATTTPKPSVTKPKDTTYNKKEVHKNQVQISQAQPAVNGTHVSFTVYLPKVYGSNGYCKVLVKRDGDGAYWTERKVALSGTNTCMITVARSELEPGVTNWQTYVMFEDYDTKDYSSWADRKTFTL